MKLYDIGESGIWTRGRLNRKAYPHHIIAELRAKKIGLVVSLTPDGEPVLAAGGYDDIRYLHLPMRDVNDRPMTDEEVNNARMAAREVADHVDAGTSDALVMCRAGRNRTGLVVALAIQQLMPTWSGTDALDHVRTFRPGACMIKADGSDPRPHRFELYLDSVPNDRGERGYT